MALYTYEPSEVTLMISGYKLTGWTNINVEFDSRPFRIKRGIRGKNTRVRDKNTSATITISVLQQGMANHVFSEIHALDIVKGNARLELSLQDLSGDTVLDSDDAYIDGFPNFAFAATAQDRTWVIQCLSTRNVKVGSNFKPSINLF